LGNEVIKAYQIEQAREFLEKLEIKP